MSQIPILWRLRAEPLPPRAVYARGTVALALARRLLSEGGETLARLSGVSANGLLVFTGEAEALPWVDGVGYLGLEPDAPALYLPTLKEANVPAPLLERAFRLRAPETPLAVLLDPGAIVSLRPARAVSRISLEEWLKQEAV